MQFKQGAILTLPAENIITGLVDTFGENPEKINLIKNWRSGIEHGKMVN